MLNPELMKYVMYVLRRFWIVVAAAALLGAVAFLFINRQDPTYRAEARIFIGNALDPNPDRTDVQTALLIVPTYAEFAKTTSVLQATIENLDLDMSVNSLRNRISTRIIVDTPILAIRATTTDSELSAAIANEVARNIIAEAPSSLTDAELQQMDSLRLQLEDLESQIAITRAQSADVLERLNVAEEIGDSEAELEQLRLQYAELVDRLNTSRGVVAQTSDTYVGLANRVGRLEIVEEATPPRSSTGLNPILIGAVAAFIGAGGAVAMLLLYLEYVDSNVRTAGEIKRHFKIPILGNIRRKRKASRKLTEYLTTNAIERSPIVEDYRRVQTNLLFATNDESDDPHLYLISSPEKGEGRTFNIANLAAVMAISGQRVLLVDANLRSSKIHTLFELPNDSGLTTILSVKDEHVNSDFPHIIHQSLQETAIPDLHVITSGIDGVPVSPQMLGFEKFGGFIDCVYSTFDYDVILVDTPPIKEASDSYSMAAAAEADVILVASYARTNIADVRLMIEQFEHLKTKVMGVLLNRM